MFLLGGTLALDVIQFDTRKQKYLKELVLKNFESNAPYRVSFTDYLTNKITIVCSSIELLFDEHLS